MKLRCLLGLHGPMWTKDNTGRGPYSQIMSGVRRFCPHCKTRWQGQIIDRHVGGGVHVRDIGLWEKIK